MLKLLIPCTVPGSADYMQGTRISFRTKEDAMHFAEKQGMSVIFLWFRDRISNLVAPGWDYYVFVTSISQTLSVITERSLGNKRL